MAERSGDTALAPREALPPSPGPAWSATNEPHHQSSPSAKTKRPSEALWSAVAERGLPRGMAYSTGRHRFGSARSASAQHWPHSFRRQSVSPLVAVAVRSDQAAERGPMECGGRAKRRHRFGSARSASAQHWPRSFRRQSASPPIAVAVRPNQAAERGPMKCGGRPKRRHRFGSARSASAQPWPRSFRQQSVSPLVAVAVRSDQATERGPMECGGRAKRRHRFGSARSASAQHWPRSFRRQSVSPPVAVAVRSADVNPPPPDEAKASRSASPMDPIILCVIILSSPPRPRPPRPSRPALPHSVAVEFGCFPVRKRSPNDS